MPEPNILVDRCTECPMHQQVSVDLMLCRAKNNEQSLMGPWDRRFPRWCPLLKGTLTIAAVRKKISAPAKCVCRIALGYCQLHPLKKKGLQ